MADSKISALTSATTPLAGTEVLPIVQSGVTKQVSVANLTDGRSIAASAATLTGANTATLLTLANTSGGTNATLAVTENTGVTLNLNEGATVRQLIIQQGGVETWRFNASGNFAAVNGKGIDFSASAGAGASGSLLADYEEGTHTATVTPSTSGTVTLDATVQTLGYTKVGRMVNVFGNLKVSSVASPVGAFTVSLPYASANLTGEAGAASGSIVVRSVASANIADFFIRLGEAQSGFLVYLGDAATQQADSAQQLQANTEIQLSITYATT
jgi:hypothetical protein